MSTQFRALLKNLSGVVRQNHKSFSANIPSLKIGIVGVPFCKGQANDEGVSRGPEVLRRGGLLQQLIQLGHNVRDYGDITYNGGTTDKVILDNMKDLLDVAACNLEVSNKVEEVLSADSRVLVMGGDHSVVVGSVDGHIRKKGADNVGLIYIDAHADLNTADTSPSGNVHGMTVALLIKELHDYWPYLPGMDWQKPELSADSIAYIGLRSVDKFERLLLDKFSITAFGMADIEQYGIHNVTKMALDKVDPSGTRSLHLSFDIDCLDTLEAPSTGVPVRGGMTLREGIHAMEIVHQTGRLNVLDLVEINPSIGSEADVKKTVEAAIHIIKSGYGFSRLGNVPKHVLDIPGHYSSFSGPTDV